MEEDAGEIVDSPDSVPGPQAALKRLDQSEWLDPAPAGVGGWATGAIRASTTCTPKPTVRARTRVAKTVRRRLWPTTPPAPAVELVSIRKLTKGLKKKMYRVQIEVTKHQSERIHLERESYTKTEECRLFSRTTPIVAAIETDLAQRARAQRTRSQASR